MVDVNSSYMETAQASSRPAAKQPLSFFRSMLALAALDVVMLFWILNPLSRPANALPSGHRLTAPQVDSAVGVEAKPSPLGAVAKHANSKTRAVQSARTATSADERRFVTVAYRQ